MSRKSNTEQRRAEIVGALLATMAEHGFEKATIQLIAQKAGLAPGLVHYHFKTKAEILHELIRTLADLSRRRYSDLAQAAVAPEEKLRAYINARLAKGDGADPRAVAAWVVIGAEAVRQPEVRAIYQEVVRAEAELIEALLADCCKASGRAVTEAKPLAAALLALVEGAFQLSSAAPDVMPAGYAATMAIGLFEAFIGQAH
jgi:TetR/AcrR family transcriptional regulator, transcriptional repressor of bet genes